MAPSQKHLVGIPLSLVGPVDLGRVRRELMGIENQLQEMALRSPGQEVKMPKTSRIMDELTGMNKLNLLVEADRKTLKNFLDTIHTRAPRLHISFSADPSPYFTEKLMAWIREQIHPVALLTIGLQPNIGAGCVLRTTNKYFDMSLAHDFAKKRDVLMEKLRAPQPADDAVASEAAVPAEASV
jgi:hypothetical protein